MPAAAASAVTPNVRIVAAVATPSFNVAATAAASTAPAASFADVTASPASFAVVTAPSVMPTPAGACSSLTTRSSNDSGNGIGVYGAPFRRCASFHAATASGSVLGVVGLNVGATSLP